MFSQNQPNTECEQYVIQYKKFIKPMTHNQRKIMQTHDIELVSSKHAASPNHYLWISDDAINLYRSYDYVSDHKSYHEHKVRKPDPTIIFTGYPGGCNFNHNY